MISRVLAACGVAALLALAATGCGDDDEAAVTTTAAGEGGRERVIVEASNGAFNPQAVYDKAAPGVVTVLSVFGGGGGSILGGGGGAGQGSGFVVGDDGEIVTNAHVVTDAEAGGAAEIDEAREVYVELADRNRVPADVVGFDPFADVALLKIDPDGLDLVPVELGSSDEIEVGQPVAAIGSPFGEEQSLSVGVISATDRSIDSLTDFTIDGAIQTDASINPGNSGGPLLDAEGRVLGINQQIRTASGADEGVGFAVPVDAVSRSLDQLRDDAEADYAFLGVTTQALYPQLAERLEIDAPTGALVAEVVPDGPADDAGIEAGDQDLRFQGQEVTGGGDVIVSVDGQEVIAESDLAEAVSGHGPGDTVVIEVLRDGETEEIEVELGERPEQAPQG
ncbi:MAG: S1C family serine protease [Solirubrobacterales bacterium]